MENIKIKLIINSKIIIAKEKIKNKLYFITENKDKIVKKDIYNVSIICDDCEYYTNYKNIPDNFILKKENYLCKSCRNKGKNNPAFGIKWSDERKLDKSIKYSGEGNPMYGKNIYDTWLDKYGVEIASKKMNVYKNIHSINNTGNKNPMYGKTYYDIWNSKYNKDEIIIKKESKSKKHRDWLDKNPDQLNRMIESTLSRGYRKTSIEKKVEEYLKLNNIEYKYNFILSNNQFDFMLPFYSTIIEVHGDYWHGNPKIYGEGKKKLNERQIFKIGRDIEKYKFLKENTNYKILYIWETDVNNKKYKKIIDEIYRN